MEGKKMTDDLDPFKLSEAELENLDINNYIWQKYREKLLSKPRKKRYWERENDYYCRVIKTLEETNTLKGVLPQK
jgi:hypothetical protein